MNEISKQIGLINLNISRLAPSGVGVGAFVPAHQILEKMRRTFGEIPNTR
jgi:hypothetical protein